MPLTCGHEATVARPRLQRSAHCGAHSTLAPGLARAAQEGGELLVGHESRGDLGEGVRHARLVLHLRLLPPGLRRAALILEAPTLEHGVQQPAADRPALAVTKEVRHLRRQAPQGAGQAEPGEEIGHRDADVGIGRDELLLGLAQVVTTFAVTTWYVHFANKRLDPLATEIREELEADAAAASVTEGATR